MLKFIGIGDLANVKFGNTSAYIKEKDTILLLDCGVTVFQKIVETNLLKDVNNLFIAITHNHPDHVAGLASLIFYAYYWKGIKPKIVVPICDKKYQKTSLTKFLSLQGIEDDNCDFVYDKDINLFNNNLTLSYKPINHSKNLNSYAIVLNYNDKKIYYLSDNNDKSFILDIISTLRSSDLIYTDCTTYEYKNKVHLELDTLVMIVPKNLREQVYCMHLCDEESISKIESYGFKTVKIYHK